jgi:hypothetical protein
MRVLATRAALAAAAAVKPQLRGGGCRASFDSLSSHYVNLTRRARHAGCVAVAMTVLVGSLIAPVVWGPQPGSSAATSNAAWWASRRRRRAARASLSRRSVRL